MEKIGLLAGVGHLPVECAQAASKLGYEVYAVALLSEVDKTLKDCVAGYADINVAKVGKIIDFLKEAGQSYWQVLPFGPTGFGNSPYQSFSTFAGNPYFISLDGLIEDGLLTEQEVSSIYWGSDVEKVDYGAVYEGRFKILKVAFERFRGTADKDADYQAFLKENSYWLEDYCLFMALKEQNDGKPHNMQRFGIRHLNSGHK